MITRDQAKLLLEIDASVSDLGHADRTWRENGAYYAVTTQTPPTPANSASQRHKVVIFVNKASGQIQHAPYAVVKALLEAMRPVE